MFLFLSALVYHFGLVNSMFMRVEGENHLASYAIRSSESRGRVHEENPTERRGCFEVDRDRILHAKAFRRLDEKTQVFVANSGAHYRTRLTHTLEVAQVARGLARDLALNEDLCEAIALAHDLGHPPFGHAGETVLDELMRPLGLRFEHNEQSRRVVEVLERSFPGFEGLNLTLETLEGLIKHQTAFDQEGKVFEVAAHLEAQVVNIADEIAYTNHDIDDGLRSGLIEIGELRKLDLWRMAEEKVQARYGEDLSEEVLVRRMVSQINVLMCEDWAMMTRKNLEENAIVSVNDVKNFRGQLGRFSEEMLKMVKAVRAYLYNNFYLNPKVVARTDEETEKLKRVFEFYLARMDLLPEAFSRDVVGVKDFVAGMTDLYLMKQFDQL